MSIPSAAADVGRLLKLTPTKVVFAESCTGGLVSGALTRIPGISACHCGGVVVYRNETKMAYLGIPASVLKKPGAVSKQVAELMAIKVLELTPEAEISVSVTGHLGPSAPANLDGRVYSAIAWSDKARSRLEYQVKTAHFQCNKADSRLVRQRWVVEQVLKLLSRHLEAAAKT